MSNYSNFHDPRSFPPTPPPPLHESAPLPEEPQSAKAEQQLEDLVQAGADVNDIKQFIAMNFAHAKTMQVFEGYIGATAIYKEKYPKICFAITEPDGLVRSVEVALGYSKIWNFGKPDFNGSKILVVKLYFDFNHSPISINLIHISE